MSSRMRRTRGRKRRRTEKGRTVNKVLLERHKKQKAKAKMMQSLIRTTSRTKMTKVMTND